MSKFLDSLIFIDGLGNEVNLSLYHNIINHNYIKLVVFVDSSDTEIDLNNLKNENNIISAIDWGDGNVLTDFSHTYTMGGNYIIYIWGDIKIIPSLFQNYSWLIGVELGKGVTTIDNSAFQLCANLTNIVISESITTIDQNAFFQCSGLETIVIQNTGSGQIAGNAFNGISSSAIYYYCGILSDSSLWYNFLNDAQNPKNYINSCESIDLSKYTIIKTTDTNAIGSEGIILLITEAAQS